MPKPYELSLSESAFQIIVGDLSPVELVESLLQRIDALEPSLKAWVYLDRESVLAEARAKAEEVASARRPNRTAPWGSNRAEGYLLHGRYSNHGVFEAVRRFRSRLRRCHGGPTAGCRRPDVRQDRHHGICLPRPIDHGEPVEPGAHSRGFQQRFGGGGGRQHVRRGHGFPDRGIGAAAGCL